MYEEDPNDHIFGTMSRMAQNNFYDLVLFMFLNTKQFDSYFTPKDCKVNDEKPLFVSFQMDLENRKHLKTWKKIVKKYIIILTLKLGTIQDKNMNLVKQLISMEVHVIGKFNCLTLLLMERFLIIKKIHLIIKNFFVYLC